MDIADLKNLQPFFSPNNLSTYNWHNSCIDFNQMFNLASIIPSLDALINIM